MCNDILSIPDNYQIVITYSPISEMTGHMREVWDYYFLLKKYFSVAIFFHTPNISRNKILMNSLLEYNIDDEDKKDIERDFFHSNNEKKLILAPKAVCLLCDGNIRSLKNRHINIICKKLICFKCADYNFDELYFDYKNTIFLQDYRIYGNKSLYKIYDYKKKINFSKYKTINFDLVKPRYMFYLTQNCRYQSDSVISEIMDEYGTDKEFLILAPKNNSYDVLKTKYHNLEIQNPPISNFYLNFETYIYTPVPRHFDCSPRIITECAFYNKKVEYYNIDYYDIGLETRRYDIEHDFDSLVLKDDDEIIDIIRGEM